MLVAPQATNIQVLLWENIFFHAYKSTQKTKFTKTLQNAFQNAFQGLYMLFEEC